MRSRLKQLKQLTDMVFGRDSSNSWTFLTPGQHKYIHKVGDGSASSVVMAPLLWIGRNFPEAPPALWEKLPNSSEEERVLGKGERGGDHIMLELITRPNQHYSGAKLWRATVIDYHLSGDGYWIKIRDRVGRPVELWWTPSSIIKPVGDEITFIDHYDYRPGAETIELPPEDVVHFQYGIDPENPRVGRSPLSSLLQEVFTDDEARDFTSALLGNMGVPGIVVAPKNSDAMPSPEDVRATKEKIKEDYTGDRRGEPLVMSGPTSVSQFGFSPQQLTLRDIRRIPEERVSACLGVPAIVAGLGAGLDRSTFANMEEARAMAYEDCLIPAQNDMSDDVHIQLLPDFEPDDYFKYRFGFDLSNVRVLQEDRTAIATRMNIGVSGGWVQVAEARRALDLEVDDADEIYLRTSSVVEVRVGEAMVAPAALLSPGSPGQPALPNGNQPQLPPGDQPRLVASNGNSNVSKRAGMQALKLSRTHAQLVARLNKDHRVLTAAMTEELEADFASLGWLCAETYASFAPSMHITRARHGVLVEEKMIDATTLALMIVNAVREQFSKTFRRRFESHTKRVLDQTISTINDTTGLSVGVPDFEQRQLLEAGGKRIGLVDIEGQTRDALFNAITEGNVTGSGPDSIARDIRARVPSGPFVNAGPTYRSKLIARTETTWARNTSSLRAYRASDVVDRVMALDGHSDPEKDPECAYRDGREFSFDEAEIELSKEHPNGTLAFAPVVSKQRKDFDPNQPRDAHGRWGSNGGTTSVAEDAFNSLSNGESVTIDGSDSLLELSTMLRNSTQSVNLSKLHVNNMDHGNLFDKHETETPREQMPQIPGDVANLDGFMKMLGERGIGGTMEMVSPQNLHATQNELDGHKAANIASKYDPAKAGVMFIDKNGAVLDGHHRWAAGVIFSCSDPNYKLKALRIDADIHTILGIAEEYDKSVGIAHQAFGGSD